MKNNKKRIIASIQKAAESHKVWLSEAQLLVDGKSTYSVQKPVECIECDFGILLSSEKKFLSGFSYFKEIEKQHKEFHKAYEALYIGANEVVDAETLNALTGNFTRLEKQSELLVENVEKIQEALENTSEDELLENSIEDETPLVNEIEYEEVHDDEVAEEVAEEEVQEEEKENIREISPKLNLNHNDVLSPSIMTVKLDSKQYEMHKQLKEMDLVQLVQEQELTEQEIQQLENRQELTTQGVEQISQYKQLKKDEITQLLNEHKKLEEKNAKAKELSEEKLNSVKKEISSKLDGLEKFKLVDQKLESRQAEEREKEQAILDNFERQQYSDKQAIIELEQQRKKWEVEAKKLKQQLLLIEQDIDDLVKQKEEKQLLLDNSNLRKEQKLQELEEQSQKQAILDEQKSKVKETKQAELADLEQEKVEIQEEISQLEAEAAELENQKLAMDKEHKQDLETLEQQQQAKQAFMKKLDQDKNRKLQEFKELVHQQEVIKKDLAEMEKQHTNQLDSEKELEEA